MQQKIWLEGKGKLFHQWAKLRTKGPQGQKHSQIIVFTYPNREIIYWGGALGKEKSSVPRALP